MIYVPISIGELIDKLSILEVKKDKIKDKEKLELINKEFELLYNLSITYLDIVEISNLYYQLCNTNKSLWDIEDRLRVIETQKKYGEEFIENARKVYYTNDKRFELKNQINKLSNSEIREVKEYIKY